MSGPGSRGRAARRRASAVAVCSVLAAVAGGALLAAPADASPLGGSDACAAAPTALVDRTGVVDLDGLTDPVSGAAAGLIACGTQAAPVDGPARTASASPIPSEPSAPTTDPAVTAPTEATQTAPDDSAAQPSSLSTAASLTGATRVSHLTVLRSSNTVYPVKDGYRDSVRFAVHATNAAGSLVPVVGEAVLSRAGRTVTRWHIDGSTETLTWNGRVGRRIQPGLYTLTVTVWSPDGSTTSGHTLVRVLDKHLVRHAVTVRSNVGATSVSADMPRELLKAYSTGKITCRVATVAAVHGAAKLVFSNNGVSRTLVLRNGAHTTKPLPVPQGFDHVTITHRWKKGSVHLESLKAIWTYSTLS